MYSGVMKKTDVLIPLEAPLLDARGFIQPLLERQMKSALLISSVKGAVRANHYHKTDWHYCYVLKGAIEYYHRPFGAKGKPKFLLVKAGQMVFTPPMVEHAMKFSSATDFLTLSRNARDQKAYEKDVIRVNLLP